MQALQDKLAAEMQVLEDQINDLNKLKTTITEEYAISYLTQMQAIEKRSIITRKNIINLNTEIRLQQARDKSATNPKLNELLDAIEELKQSF